MKIIDLSNREEDRKQDATIWINPTLGNYASQDYTDALFVKIMKCVLKSCDDMNIDGMIGLGSSGKYTLSVTNLDPTLLISNISEIESHDKTILDTWELKVTDKNMKFFQYHITFKLKLEI